MTDAQVSSARAQELFGKYIRKMQSWEAFAKLLKKYSIIERLILNFHGAGGYFKIGGQGSSPKKIKKLFEVKGKGKRVDAPIIHRIDWLSCNMGEDPLGMLKLGQIFNANMLTAHNAYNLSSSTIITNSGTSLGDRRRHWTRIQSQYRDYVVATSAKAGWWVPSPDINYVEKNPGKYKLHLTWFRTDLVTDGLPSLGRSRNTKDFRPQRDARERRMCTLEGGDNCKRNLENLKKEYAHDPQAFGYVVVYPNSKREYDEKLRRARELKRRKANGTTKSRTKASGQTKYRANLLLLTDPKLSMDFVHAHLIKLYADRELPWET